ncbi:hypothetical protein G8C92_06865, partial [Paenibacillus donghaensis]|uniref:FIVAR domain-containing protein n=1 Tax=Paenibacillus donghaensis TaxID=414771 RepID=UPI0018846FE8
MSAKSNKFYWKKQLMILLAVVLVSGGFPAVFSPQVAKAEQANPAPGGVSDGLISWIDGEKSVSEPDRTEGKNVLTLQDLGEDRKWNGTSTYLTNAINFNGGIQFPGKGLYQIAQFDMGDSAREIFSIQVNEASQSVTDKSFPWEFGSGVSSQPNSFYGPTIRTVFGRESILDIKVDNDLKNATMMNIWSAPNDWSLSLNGVKKHSEPSNTPNFTSRTTPNKLYYIGAGHNSIFNGRISEVILYNKKLDDFDRQKVSSYIALKYGLTLKNDKGDTTNYVASNGTEMWTVAHNTGYGNRITGIGRDDASGLEQKQSKSQEADANVTIALGNTVAASNAENGNDSMMNNTSFFTFSDDNAAATYSTSKIQEPQTGHELKKMERVFKVEETNWKPTNVTLKLDVTDDPAAPVYNYYLITSDDGVTFNNPPVELKLNSSYEVTVSSDKLKYFTFAKVYKEDLKTLVDGLQKYEQDHYTVESWNVFDTAKTNADKVLSDGNASQKEIDDALSALQAGIAGLTLKSSKVDKTALENKVKDIEKLVEGNYTADSWKVLQDALKEAEAVLVNENATQEQVDAALSKLSNAYDALE